MLSVYLAGEIHINWKEEIIQLCEKEKLDVKFTSPVTDHEAPDNCGVEILGAEEKNFWKYRKRVNINSIRSKKSIQDSDVIIFKFGEKFN
jgi:YtoQ family protein